MGKLFSALCPHCQAPGVPRLGQGSSAALVAVLCSTPSPRAQFHHNEETNWSRSMRTCEKLLEGNFNVHFKIKKRKSSSLSPSDIAYKW